MVYGLWHSAAGLQAQQYRQAVIANNLANASTPGFKPDRIAFQERLSASRAGVSLGPRHPTLDTLTGGLFASPVYTDYTPAGSVPSANPFDVSINGDGFLSVRTPEGMRYTRDGRLIMDKDGALRHVASGGAMVDAADRPIVLDPASHAPVKIDASGRVRQGESIVGQLAVVDFEDREALEKEGHNLSSGDKARSIPADGRVRQFSTENSGVDPVTTLVEMIAASRAYETNAAMLSMQNDTLGRTVNEVGRLG